MTTTEEIIDKIHDYERLLNESKRIKLHGHVTFNGANTKFFDYIVGLYDLKSALAEREKNISQHYRPVCSHYPSVADLFHAIKHANDRAFAEQRIYVTYDDRSEEHKKLMVEADAVDEAYVDIHDLFAQNPSSHYNLLEHIGEHEVKYRLVNCDINHEEEEEVFGFDNALSPSSVSGDKQCYTLLFTADLHYRTEEYLPAIKSWWNRLVAPLNVGSAALTVEISDYIHISEYEKNIISRETFYAPTIDDWEQIAKDISAHKDLEMKPIYRVAVNIPAVESSFNALDAFGNKNVPVGEPVKRFSDAKKISEAVPNSFVQVTTDLNGGELSWQNVDENGNPITKAVYTITPFICIPFSKR